ncbi:MAG: ATP-binding protein [Gammaproteobacteria bacterium]
MSRKTIRKDTAFHAKIKELELENHTLKSQLSGLLQATPGSIYCKDLNGCYISANIHALKMVHLNSEEEIIGKTDFDLFNASEAEIFRQVDLEVIEHDKEITKEESVKSPEGRELIQLSTKKPLKDENGKIIGIVGNTVDISYLKDIEKKLIEAKEKAELAAKAKIEFLANMSHDVKTPLGGMVGMAELLLTKLSNTNLRKDVHEIISAGQQTLQLFENCIEISKLDTTTVHFDNKKIQLKDIIEGMKTLYLPSVKAKKLVLDVYYDHAIPKYVVADRSILQRMLLNLVGNAIKFTDEGAITITASLLEMSNKEQALVKIAVKDTGIGIPEGKQSVIFDRLTRLSPSYEGKYEGTGLGLYVVKKFVDAMKGNIQVNSQEGHGSEFVLLLPFNLPSVGVMEASVKATTEEEKYINFNKYIIDESAKYNERNESLKILLVEDNVLAKQIGEGLLKDIGCDVDSVETGKAALEIFEPGKYDMVLMDIGLPDMDGYAVTSSLRENEQNQHTRVPVIALTAHAIVDVEAFCSGAGMDAVISKPISREKAKALINKFVYCKEVSADSLCKLKLEKSSETDALEIIDIEDGIQFVGSKEGAENMLDSLIKSLPSLTKELSEGYITGDMEQLFKSTHKFYGGLAMIGVPRLRHVTKSFKESLKKKEYDRMHALYESVMKEINSLLEAYEIL